MTFEGLGLDPKLIQATDALGFKTPTPIQEKAIPVLLSGTKDFVGLAQTGTGKTAAFGFPYSINRKQRKIPAGIDRLPNKGILYADCK